MAQAKTSVGKFPLLGGELCLDFINTIDWRRGPRQKDFIPAYNDLLDWSESTNVIDSATAKRLRKKASALPGEAEASHQRAIGMREALYTIFSAIAAGKSAPGQSIARFNKALAALTSKSGLCAHSNGFDWTWTGPQDDFDLPLWPVAESALRLLTSADVQRVGECLSENCGWLFLDASKNRKRQWCSMKGCGNREKARRHYERISKNEI